MKNRFFMIDDFYSDPDGLVSHAFKSKIHGADIGNYAGRMTEGSFLSEQHRSFFENLLGESPINSATDGNGKLRFTLSGDSFRQNIHFDGAGVNWSGVVYLSKNHPDVEGTIFWEHIETGLEEIPLDIEKLKSHNLASKEKITKLLEVDGIDPSKWKKTFSVPYRYNRLVLFRPWLFHSPGPAFGSELKDSRIVQTLFLGP